MNVKYCDFPQIKPIFISGALHTLDFKILHLGILKHYLVLFTTDK